MLPRRCVFRWVVEITREVALGPHLKSIRECRENDQACGLETRSVSKRKPDVEIEGRENLGLRV